MSETVRWGLLILFSIPIVIAFILFVAALIICFFEGVDPGDPQSINDYCDRI